MMKSLRSYRLLCALLIALSACKDKFDNVDAFDNLHLPPYTETGKGTFGCLINGSIWTVFGKYYDRGIMGRYWDDNFLSASLELDNRNQEGLLVSGRMTKVKNNQSVYDTQLSFEVVFKDTLAGQYFLRSDSVGRMEFRDFRSPTVYQTNGKNPLMLTINKFSNQEKIISGIFEGYLFNPANLTDSIKISQGRFDIKR